MLVSHRLHRLGAASLRMDRAYTDAVTLRATHADGVMLSDRVMSRLGMGVDTSRARLQFVLAGSQLTEPAGSGARVVECGWLSAHPAISSALDSGRGVTLDVDFAPARAVESAVVRASPALLAAARGLVASLAVGGSEIDAAYAALRALLRAEGFELPALTTRTIAPDDAVTLAALDRVLTNLSASPAMVDAEDELGQVRRTVVRRVSRLNTRLGLHGLGGRLDFRATRDFYRLAVAAIATSAPGATTERVARWSGFASPTALCHAFARAGLPSPGALRRDLLWTGANLP